jgi:Fe-S-cluster-containing dehydrogenase component/formate-dependent nitrite reductase membrane component NrfD
MLLDPVEPASRWAKVIDQTRCIGCHACTTACKSENEVPLGVSRTYVKSVDVGIFPQARRAYQVTRCNQCEDAPCVTACPTSAMFKRRDGIVDFAKSVCIGCKACMAACPYDAIFINPDDHSAEKCNFCAHRLDMGLEPACVVVCPTEALLVGDLADPRSRVAAIVQRDAVAVRRPEKATRPLVFYKGAHQLTLDPLAARRPPGGLFMWSEQRQGSELVVSGHPAGWNSSAAALLSYDVGHAVPWDWRVSLYTWTKSVSSGAYVVALGLLLGGVISGEDTLWRWVAPIASLVFFAITGALLIGDLEHPERFYLIFTRPQWRSWLVKGAFVLAAFGALLGLHLLASALGTSSLDLVLKIAGLPLGVLAAVYTAYLFAQSKGRDLWQSPLLPAHLMIQAVVAGSATLLAAASILGQAVPSLVWILTSSSVAHLLLVCAEATLPHVSAHARLAAHEMVRGRYRSYYRAGIVLVGGAVLSPWIGVAAVPLALAGLMAHEHAYVQAAQAVPLA